VTNVHPLVVLAAALATALVLTPGAGAAQHPWSSLSAEVQIRLAVQAGPKEFHDGAAVQGYDAAGSFVTLRRGSNGLICMAPNPAAQSLEVSCHSAGLEPFFARGRELSDQGVTGQDRVMARWKEYDEGKLAIPTGSVNYILTGSGFDAATGEIADAYLRWTIYTPGATVQSTGISDQPSAGGPWLMFPGTAGAHIMITPPRGGGGR
jgi:hypothetical protein